MRETVLLYNFNERGRAMKVRQALLPLGFRLKAVDKRDYWKPVGVLAGLKADGAENGSDEEDQKDAGTRSDAGDSGGSENGGDTRAESSEAPDFEDEMILMAGFTSARIDALIKALRKWGVGRIDYKAVLTDTNKDWDSLRLYEEIRKEHEAMSGE